jgi:uncharacterized damage-inducible protein DinB
MFSVSLKPGGNYMKGILLIQAGYMQDADRKVYSLLSTLSNEEREAERGSYYGSLSGLARHILGGTLYFHSMFKAALKENPAAIKALSYPAAALPEGRLTEAQWKNLESLFESGNGATVQFVSALKDTELNAPVPVEWYGGKPAEVPLYFMFNNLFVHGTHHRGQISQILDELKVDNDYSGIDVAFLKLVH